MFLYLALLFLLVRGQISQVLIGVSHVGGRRITGLNFDSSLNLLNLVGNGHVHTINVRKS